MCLSIKVGKLHLTRSNPDSTIIRQCRSPFWVLRNQAKQSETKQTDLASQLSNWKEFTTIHIHPWMIADIVHSFLLLFLHRMLLRCISTHLINRLLVFLILLICCRERQCLLTNFLISTILSDHILLTKGSFACCYVFGHVFVQQIKAFVIYHYALSLSTLLASDAFSWISVNMPFRRVLMQGFSFF